MGGYPPGAEVTGKLPPFDPCGPWVAGILRGPFARVCVPGLGPLPKYSLRREHFFPGFQQVLSGSVADPPPRRPRVWDCRPPRPPREDPGAPGDFQAASLSSESARPAGSPGLWAVGWESAVCTGRCTSWFSWAALGKPQVRLLKVLSVKPPLRVEEGRKHRIWSLMPRSLRSATCWACDLL